MKKFKILRKKYPRFIYENYDWRIEKRSLKISFDFKIDHYESGSRSIYFRPKIVIKNVKKSQIERVREGVLNDLVFHLGLIEMFSYWKATCSPEIEILAGSLNQEQVRWWKDLINRGMGQFFFENKINFLNPDFVKIKFTKAYDRANLKTFKTGLKEDLLRSYPNRRGVLVPVGGGKDSIVTLEILKKVKKKITCFSLNPTGAIKKIMKIAGCQNSIIVERKIDPKLLELNRKGFLNGHTPFSAYLAFLSILVAVLFGKKYIAFSNERSSNEGNVKYLGRVINHQYSKSFDFEKKFRRYSKKYLTSDVEYFSFLRPLYEIQISKLFSNYPKYFDSFLSCNVAYQTNSGQRKPIRKWCGKCPKCLFVFAILYPFIGEKIIKIFKKNLFEDKNLLPLMPQLIGEKKFKPFECVGTKKESLIAFYFSLLRANKKIEKLPLILKYFKKRILPKYPDLEKKAKEIMGSWSDQNNLPKEFKNVFRQYRHLLKGNLCQQF